MNNESQGYALIGILFVITLYLMSTGSFNNGTGHLDTRKLKNEISVTVQQDGMKLINLFK